MDQTQEMDTKLRRAFADGCTLSEAELDQRLDEIQRLARFALVDTRETAGRLELTFEATAAPVVHDLVRRERECCGHLELAVEETDDVVRVAIRPRPAAPPASCGCPMCGG